MNAPPSHNSFPASDLSQSLFSLATTIRSDVPERVHVRLEVYNVLGQRVMTPVDELKEAGTYRAVFDARRLATGVYIYRMTAGSFNQTRKMLLLK